MKICLVGHEYPPNVISGPGRYALNLVEELSREGHEVTVITPLVREGKSYERSGNVEVYRLWIKQFGFMEKLLPNLVDTRIMFNLRLRRFFRKFDISTFDILHILDVHDSYFLNDEIRKRIPVIISVNDYYSFETSWNPLAFHYFSTDILLRYAHYNMTKVLNSRYLKKAWRIISDTKYTAKSIHRRVGIRPEIIDVIYKGVDTDKFTGKTGRNKYESRRILYIGSNMERKGVGDIIKAMPEITEQFPDCKLTIIGRASILYMHKLRKMIKRYNLKNNVEFINTVPSEKIMSYYEDANVLVIAPVIEDLAQVLLESMAMRTPVVCTNVGANPEAIVNEYTGLLVEPKNPLQIADAIIEIFSDPEKAKKFGENGRKSVENLFNSRRMLEETFNVYDTCLNSTFPENG